MNQTKKANIPPVVLRELAELSREYKVKKLILFGSRARGDNLPRSDIDLAVIGCRNFSDFAYDVDNMTSTLLQFDIINLDEPVSESLVDQIQRDGIELYPDTGQWNRADGKLVPQRRQFGTKK